MHGRVLQRMALGAQSRLPVGSFHVLGQADTARTNATHVMYHGKVGNSMFDKAFKHVILEFPQACESYLGKSYLLHFVRHYEEDLWHGIMNKVIVQVGHTSNDGGVDTAPTKEVREQTLQDVSTIVLQHDKLSNHVSTLTHETMPRLSAAKSILKGCCPRGRPEEIVLSLQEITSNTNVGMSHREAEVQEYRLTPTTQEELANEVAGIYPSKHAADIIHQKLLTKV